MKITSHIAFAALLFFSSTGAFAQSKETGCSYDYMLPGGGPLCWSPSCMTDVTINEGDSILLSVAHCGTTCGQRQQQWYRDGVAITELMSGSFVIKTAGLYTAKTASDCLLPNHLLNGVNVTVNKTTTAVQPEPRAQKLLIYPNPAEDVVNIEFENISGTKEIDIYNLFGQRVKNIHTANDVVAIDIRETGNTPLFIVVRDASGKTWTKHISRAK